MYYGLSKVASDPRQDPGSWFVRWAGFAFIHVRVLDIVFMYRFIYLFMIYICILRRWFLDVMGLGFPCLRRGRGASRNDSTALVLGVWLPRPGAGTDLDVVAGWWEVSAPPPCGTPFIPHPRWGNTKMNNKRKRFPPAEAVERVPPLPSSL